MTDTHDNADEAIFNELWKAIPDSATARKLEIAFTHWRDKAVVVALRADRQALQSQKDALYEAVKSHAPEDDNYNGGEPEVYNEAQTVNRNNREWNEVLAAAFGKDKL